MPRVRKLGPEEVRDLEREAAAYDAAWMATTGLEDGGREPPPRPGGATRAPAPRIGDVVALRDGGRAIVLRVRRQTDGAWDAAEVLADGRQRWVTPPTIVQIVGRPKGVSRIDHPRRRTHGWFVRVYEGSEPRIARLFSDRKYRGRGAALAAALAFLAWERGEHEAQMEGDEQPEPIEQVS